MSFHGRGTVRHIFDGFCHVFGEKQSRQAVTRNFIGKRDVKWENIPLS